MKQRLLNSGFILIVCFLSLQLPAQQKASVIFDTDMGPDYDDVGAIALLHAFADSGYANLLGTIACTKYEGVAGVIDVLNTYFRRPDLPVGVPKNEAVADRDFQHWSDTLLAQYPHSIKSNADAPDAISVYRKLLSAQPDGSVTIVTVGFLTNLAALLESPADSYSNLKGLDLVKRKTKLLVSMAGMFPSGREFNIHKDAKAARRVYDQWPTPVILSGFEIGAQIKTGLPLVNNKGIQRSPVKDVFRISIPLAKSDSAGRMSWDQTAVVVAVKGHQPWYTLRRGIMTVLEDGSNNWADNESGPHYHLVAKLPPGNIQAYINKLMQHQPLQAIRQFTANHK
jgi:pyrimidine-specific ribonucleoside hydrolase